MSDLIEPVGARLTLLNGPAFRAGLAAATDALQAFNDEQARAAELAASSQESIAAASKESSATVVDSSAVAADAVKAQAAATVEASDVIVGAADDAAVGVTAANVKIAASSTAAAAETKTAWTSAVATSTKILKYAGVIGAVVVYEGVKKYMSFQQQIAQLAISAGVSKSQLPAFTKMAIAVSDATGMAAVSVGDMMYRIASANPKIKITTQSMEEMVAQAGNLAVLTSTGSPNAVADTVARLYGAIVSNAMSLTRGGPALTYSAAGGKAINEWVLAAAGHGDITPAQLVAAMGTGLLPVAKTFGLSLNDIGAMLDVLTPAMGAQQASTRLKTAIGLLGAPSQKAVEAAELVGGNATTMGGLLRTGGPTALMNYLAGLQTKAMSGASFIGGGIFGAESGKYSGVSGAADFLKSIGFTNAGLVSLLQTQGISGLKSLTPAQLQGLGFNAGTTGKTASATVMADLIGQMFGGGRTGAAIMQLLNERGTLANKQAAIAGAETPKSYGAALKLAFAEPIVTFHKFEQQLENLTIRVGKDVTPALDSFMNVLLKIGSWFGKNKWALEALGAAAGAIVAGAAIVKTVSVVEKLGTGVINIGKYLLTGTTAVSGGAALTGAASALDASAASLQTAADMLMGRGGVPGVTPVGTGTVAGEEVGEEAGVLGVGYAGAKSLSTALRGAATRTALGALAFYGLNKWGAPAISKHVKNKQESRSINDALRGAIVGGTIGSYVAPVVGTAVGAGMGAAIGGLYSMGNQNAYSKAIQSYEASHTVNVRFASQAALGVTAANFAQRATSIGMSPNTIASIAPAKAPAIVTGTNSTGYVEAQHAQFDLSSAAKKYSVTADSLKTASDDQKTAAQQTNTAATNLNSAAASLELAGAHLSVLAGNAAAALSPSNIHALAVAGTKTSVARK
jgi:hypothetical protein